MRMWTFSGFQASSCLHTKVALATSTRRRKASRFMPKAMDASKQFTKESKDVIMLAQEEARSLGHSYVGFGHILLGLIGVGTGMAAKVLKSMGLNLEDARVEVEKLIGQGSKFNAVEIPFTARAKLVLELILEDAHKHFTDAGPEQLLLALLQEVDGVAVRFLENLGADPDNIRTQVIKMVDESTFGEVFLLKQLEAANIRTGVLNNLFSKPAMKVILLSREEARRLGHNYVGTEQILLGLIREETCIAAKVFKLIGINLKDAREEVQKIIGRGSGFVAAETPFTPRVRHVLQVLVETACKNDSVVGSESLLFGLLAEDETFAARALKKLGADRNKIVTEVVKMQMNGGSEAAVGAGVRSKMPTLEKYGTNLTKLAEEGKLDPVVGRQSEIERVIRILGRRTKNNPCLIGEAGVGKTAVVEGLAQRIANGHVPEIQGKKVISLDMGRLVAGTDHRGEFEERLMKLMEEIKQSGEIFMFIDEIHTLIGAGAADGANDAVNILKPALARGELQCIGATTFDEYRKHIETNPALARRFQLVKVPEPSVDETINILKDLRDRYEIHHNLRYTDDALVAAAELSHQYISGRLLPDKAIDLIDEAGSYVRHLCNAQEMNKAVTEADIQHVISDWTGIPMEKASSNELDRLLKMEQTLHSQIIGQDEAVKAVCHAIRSASVGLKNPDRPIASFIFAGPTGVGKTQLAKALATFYLGSDEAMIRLDMSEYMERHTVSKLIGSPPGYVGYAEGNKLTEAVRRRPHTIVLLDEIEKAHPDVFNLMLQILDDGRLTDSTGRTVDFKNTLVIMTTNIGSNVIEKGGRTIGFNLDYDEKDSSCNKINSLVTKELKQVFRPEFLNRVDETIVFKQLTKSELKQIAEIMLKDVLERLKKSKEIQVQLTERFRDRVAEEGYNPGYGARPLRRAIIRLLEKVIAEKMVARDIREGDSLIIDVDSDSSVTVVNSNGGDLLPLALAGVFS